MRVPSAVYDWTATAPAPSIPWTDPPPIPPAVSTDPGTAGETFHVAIGGFPTGRRPVVIWDAVVTGLQIRDHRLGPNAVTVSFPASPQNMRLCGLEYPTETDQSGHPLYAISQAVSWELMVGSTVDGYVRWRFIVRDEVTVTDGLVTVNGVGFVGGWTADRVIGAPTRLNLLGDGYGSFESGTLNGWTIHGAGTAAGVDTGGPDGRYVAWVTGTPDASHYIERRVRYAQPPRNYGRQDIAGTALVKLPTGLDIDDYGLVTIAVINEGVTVWPPPSGEDFRAGIVTSDMVRGSWVTDNVVGIGRLPVPPYNCYVCIRLHPVDETEKVRYDDAAIVRDESSSTEDPVDLTHHVTTLINGHAQTGRDKSKAGITAVTGTPTGIVETGTWKHADGQELDEALNALTGRGMDIFDLAGPGRQIKATKRRGSRRDDIIVHTWDVVGSVPIKVDPGAIRTALRITSSAGSIWGGADEGAIDRDAANGQIIDALIAGPFGMTPYQLRQYGQNQLNDLARVPSTFRLRLTWECGMRLQVGDSVRVAVHDQSAAHKDWMKVSQWEPDFYGRFVDVDFGTDPDLGGK